MAISERTDWSRKKLKTQRQLAKAAKAVEVEAAKDKFVPIWEFSNHYVLPAFQDYSTFIFSTNELIDVVQELNSEDCVQEGLPVTGYGVRDF